MGKIGSFLSFTGTAKRARFLQFIPAALLIWLGAAYLDETFVAPNLCHVNENWICYLPGEVREGITLDMIAFFLLIFAFFSVVIRRLAAHGMPWFYALLSLPALYVLWLFLYASDEPVQTVLTVIAVIGILPLLYWMLKKSDAS